MGSYRSKSNAHDTETREIKWCSVREEQSWKKKWDLVSLIRLSGEQKKGPKIEVPITCQRSESQGRNEMSKGRYARNAPLHLPLKGKGELDQSYEQTIIINRGKL